MSYWYCQLRIREIRISVKNHFDDFQSSIRTTSKYFGVIINMCRRIFSQTITLIRSLTLKHSKGEEDKLWDFLNWQILSINRSSCNLDVLDITQLYVVSNVAIFFRFQYWDNPRNHQKPRQKKVTLFRA